MFDGNIERLSGPFLFNPARNRAVSVHSSYVPEALEKLYDAHDLVDEIRDE